MSETLNRDALLELHKQVESTLIAALSGARDRSAVQRWIDGDALPSSDENRRIEFAHKEFKRVAKAVSSDTARVWFIGRNVGDKEIPPFEAIRLDDFEGVERSADRLINDDWS